MRTESVWWRPKVMGFTKQWYRIVDDGCIVLGPSNNKKTAMHSKPPYIHADTYKRPKQHSPSSHLDFGAPEARHDEFHSERQGIWRSEHHQVFFGFWKLSHPATPFRKPARLKLGEVSRSSICMHLSPKNSCCNLLQLVVTSLRCRHYCEKPFPLFVSNRLTQDSA